MAERVIMTRILRNHEKDDGSFDLEFWQKVGAEERFAAAWEMVQEAAACQGQGGLEPLQRSVTRTVRSSI
jgi:hypothetical protein